MSFERLKERAWRANLDLVNAGLVTLTFGNASEADPQAGVAAIKPSGVSYDRLTPDDMVVLSIETGERMEGSLNPSSDTPTHLAIYRAFPSINGLTHTHSIYATAWAQSCREIPCLGTTHADHFNGPVPLTRELSDQEIESA
ncbi:MAG: class II aldolase/adducin family protein, partial [Deltaproteobacteria bacterium]|nr:class II aldolase/adducin family protein [Deltaproteobacteria bacterium]